jgi:hypothetical protein
MAKRSTNFNGGAQGSAGDRRNNAEHLASLSEFLGLDPREVAQHIADRVKAAEDACMWRVCWKKRGGMAEDWKHELKPSLREARSRALDLRDRLCIAIVQKKHTDGTWIDA